MHNPFYLYFQRSSFLCVSFSSGWLQPNHSSLAPIAPRPWETFCYVSVLITKYLIIWQNLCLGNCLPGAIGNPDLPQSEIKKLIFLLWKCSYCLVKKPEAEYLLLGFTLVKAASKVLPELVQIMQSRAPLDFVNCRVWFSLFCESYLKPIDTWPAGQWYLYILYSSMIFSPGLGRQLEKMCENFLKSSKSFWLPIFELMAS